MNDILFTEEKPEVLVGAKRVVVPPEMLDAAVNVVDVDGGVFFSRDTHWPGRNACLQGG